ncbi:translational activator of GCN4, partial [Nowakowskiella sp. JEL0078]
SLLESTLFASLISLHNDILNSLILNTIAHDKNSVPQKNFVALTVAKRRTIKALKFRDKTGDRFKTLLSHALKSGDAIKYASTINICFSVCESRESIEDLIDYKDDVLSWFSKWIVTSKIAVNDEFLSAFRYAWKCWLDSECFEKILLPQCERALLRAPEVVLKVLTSLFTYGDLDTSKYFTKFVDSLLSNLKSSNLYIQTDATNLWAILSQNSSDPKSHLVVCDKLIETLSGKISVEQKNILYPLFAQIPSSAVVSKKIINSIIKLAPKETNETVLSTALSAAITHISVFVQENGTDLDKLLDFVCAGVISGSLGKRVGYWTIVNSLTLQDVEELSKSTRNTVQKFIQAIISTVEKVQDAGISVLDANLLKNGGVSHSEGIIALKFWMNVKLVAGDNFGKFLLPEPPTSYSNYFLPTSFLYNQRFFKILTISEQITYLSIFTYLLRLPELFKLADSKLAPVLSYLLFQSNFETQNKLLEFVSSIISDANREHATKILNAVRDSLSFLISQYEQERVDKATERIWDEKPIKSSNSTGFRIFRVLRALVNEGLFDEQDESIVQWRRFVLWNLLPISCHEVVSTVMGNDTWVWLCIRSGEDPKLVLENGGVEWLWNKWNESDKCVADGGILGVSGGFRKASLAAIELITDVASDVAVPIFAKWAIDAIWKRIDEKISKEEFDIWRGKEIAKKVDKADSKLLKKSVAPKKDVKGVLKTGKSAAIQPPQVNEDDLVKKKIQDIYENVHSSLDLLEAMIKGVIDSFADDEKITFSTWVPKIVDALVSLMRVEIVVVDDKDSNVILDESEDEDSICEALKEKKIILAGKRTIELWELLGRATLGNWLDQWLSPKEIVSATLLRTIGVVDAGNLGIEKKLRPLTLASKNFFFNNNKNLFTYNSQRNINSIAG